MRKIGYARVSTGSQNLDRQMSALRAERCHEVYREKASGKAVKSRPQLEKAIDALGRGDVDGRAAARKRGVHMGRKPKLTDLQRRVACQRVAKGESARSIAREWGVAHTTVARAVK